MTAEIVIMNKHGVALAADSAVSIGEQKVYNTANKLFALSKTHPLGIMIYGSASFMGIPWETIIKKYRNDHLRDNCFPTVEEHAADFLNYLSTSDIVSAATEKQFLKQRFYTIAQHMVLVLKDAFQAAFERATSPLTGDDVKATIKDWIENLETEAKRQEPIEGLTGKEKAAIRKSYKDTFSGFLNRCLEELPVTEADRKKLLSVAHRFFFSNSDLGSSTGIVIAGYGADEIFPKTESVTLTGKIGARLIVNKRSSQAINIRMGASVAPYAQREMVDTIMKGVDPELEVEIQKLVGTAIEKIPGLLAEKYGLDAADKVTMAMKEDINRIKKALSNAIDVAQRDHYIRPVIDSVAILPLAELGSMAEALINITSFKRRVTMVSESVGGPIDVALISKGDGFVWIKRKHYFDPALNHQYFINQSRRTS